MKQNFKRGTTSFRTRVFIQNSSTGAPLTGLVFNTAGLTAYYLRDGDAATTAITLVTETLGTWASGGFVEVDATHMPGMYELGVPNAALSGAGNAVEIYLQGAANMLPCLLEFQIESVDNQDAARYGLSSIPSAVAGAAGGLFIAGTNAATSITTGLTAHLIGTVDTVTNLTNAPTAGDFTAAMKTSLNAATPASIQGAVASVTGNVGGNVTGSVGSVAGSVGSVTAPVSLSANDESVLAAFFTSLGSGHGLPTIDGSGDVTIIASQISTIITDILTTALTESYAANHAAPTLSQALFMILERTGQFIINGTTITGLKLDGSTTAEVFTTNDATNPAQKIRTA